MNGSLNKITLCFDNSEKSFLAAAFQKEEILVKQRKAHSTLINMGMEKISLFMRKVSEFRKVQGDVLVEQDKTASFFYK